MVYESEILLPPSVPMIAMESNKTYGYIGLMI